VLVSIRQRKIGKTLCLDEEGSLDLAGASAERIIAALVSFMRSFSLHNCKPSERVFAEMAESVAGLYSRRRLTVGLLLCLIAFCLIVNSSWNASPDSALYLSLGESLARGEGYVFNGELHTMVPPGLPQIIAGTARVLGTDFLSYRVVMALVGFMTAVLGFLLIARVAGVEIGVLVGGVFATNYVLLYNSTFVLADVPFALFTFIALHAVLAAQDARAYGWAVVSAVLIGIPCLIRINGMAIPFAAAIFLFCSWKDLPRIERLTRIALFLIIACIPFVLWQYWKGCFPVSDSEGTYFNTVAGRQWNYQLRVIVTALVEYIPEANLALTGVSLKTGLLELPIPFLTLYGMILAFRRGERLFVPLTMLEFGGLVLTNAGSRYLIFLLPGMYLFLALGVFESAKFLSRQVLPFSRPAKTLVGVFLVLGTLNVGHDVGVIWDARHALEKYGAQNDRSLPFFSASRWLQANAPEATVLTSRPRIIHYLSRCTTVSLVRSGVPDHEIFLNTLDRLKKVMESAKPNYLYSDTKDSQYHATVVKGLESLGFVLEKIPEGSSDRYLLFRIIPVHGKLLLNCPPTASPSVNARPATWMTYRVPSQELPNRYS